jgi:hypothetical protein
MHTNIGNTDRLLRVVVGMGLILLAIMPLGLELSVIALFLLFGGILLLTGGSGYCPVYAILDISTDGRQEEFS